MKKPEEYLKDPYSRVLIWDEESGTFFAQISEFPGCFTEGTTEEETLRRLTDTAISWISAAQNLGQEIPQPFPFFSCNGKVALRMPKSLHQKAIAAARREGVSLNQFIVTAISEIVGAVRAIDKMIEKKVRTTQNVSFHSLITNLSINSLTSAPPETAINADTYQLTENDVLFAEATSGDFVKMPGWVQSSSKEAN